MPVTPLKFAVFAISSRSFGPSVVPARLMASARTRAESYASAASESGFAPKRS